MKDSQKHISKRNLTLTITFRNQAFSHRDQQYLNITVNCFHCETHCCRQFGQDSAPAGSYLVQVAQRPGSHRCRRRHHIRHPARLCQCPAGSCWSRTGSCPWYPGDRRHHYGGCLENVIKNCSSCSNREKNHKVTTQRLGEYCYLSWFVSQESPTRSLSTSDWNRTKSSLTDYKW